LTLSLDLLSRLLQVVASPTTGISRKM